ncbi:MAG: Mov34/MPN/PAD-1 family protein [Phycisphaerae bacterium]|nr:Mov34/MPN/PAD-1 family protein [Phycisphaerae bacterium]
MSQSIPEDSSAEATDPTVDSTAEAPAEQAATVEAAVETVVSPDAHFEAHAGGPDVSDIQTSGWTRRNPALASGEREPKYQAVIRQSVLDAIHGHGKSVTGVEVCGVLVGNVYQDDFGPYLHVNSSIRGDRATEHAAQVTFTAETWASIQVRMDEEHPDERIVGWYHTHPGFGIFLSGMDLFIQDHFFNLPWQVAFVYDPLGGDEGMFFWSQGKARREPFLIEADRLLLRSDRSKRETAPTLADLHAAEEKQLIAQKKAPSRQPLFEPLPPITPPPTAAEIEQIKAKDVRWTDHQAITKSEKTKARMWILGGLAFVLSFACTIWSMFFMKQEIVVVPHHTDKPATQSPAD